MKQAIELVNSHTLYKIVDDGYGRTKYQLATEEMLKHDYINHENKYDKGIKFISADSSKHYNTGRLKVNGVTYYDIRYALNNYEKRLIEEQESMSRLQRQIRDIEDDIKRLNREFPSLKQAIIEWQEYQKKEEERLNELD